MNIYVSNLSYSLTDEDLNNAFAEYGEVQSAKVITDRYTGRSRGFGFVEMNDNEGKTAIEQLNGATLDNKIISVAVSRPKEERSDNRFDNRRNNSRRNDRY
jgi:RNA recognition motif-containing protein